MLLHILRNFRVPYSLAATFYKMTDFAHGGELAMAKPFSSPKLQTTNVSTTTDQSVYQLQRQGLLLLAVSASSFPIFAVCALLVQSRF